MATLREEASGDKKTWAQTMKEVKRFNEDHENATEERLRAVSQKDRHGQRQGFGQERRSAALSKLEKELEEAEREVERLAAEDRNIHERLEGQRSEAFKLYGFQFDIADRRAMVLKLYHNLFQLAELTSDSITNDPYLQRDLQRKMEAEREVAGLLCDYFLHTIKKADERIRRFEGNLEKKLSQILKSETEAKRISTRTSPSDQRQVTLDIVRHGAFIANGKGTGEEEHLPPPAFSAEVMDVYKKSDMAKYFNRIYSPGKPVITQKEFTLLLKEFAEKCAVFAWNWVLYPLKGELFTPQETTKPADSHQHPLRSKWPLLQTADGHLLR